MKSLVRRRLVVECVDSSVTKIKTMWWIPSRGIRVSVDFANLRCGDKEEAQDEYPERFAGKAEQIYLALPEFVIRVSHLVGSEL